jgi:hypothetical protein
MQIHSVGIDLGKTTFHLVALGAAGKVLIKKEFTQRQLLTFTANLQTSLIGLEACSGAHFLGRALTTYRPPQRFYDNVPYQTAVAHRTLGASKPPARDTICIHLSINR